MATLERLDTEIRNFKGNSVKESIKRGLEEMAEHKLQMGDVQSALKYFSKSRDYCLQAQHERSMCLNIIKTSSEFLIAILIINSEPLRVSFLHFSKFQHFLSFTSTMGSRTIVCKEGRVRKEQRGNWWAQSVKVLLLSSTSRLGGKALWLGGSEISTDKVWVFRLQVCLDVKISYLVGF